ncbi:peroxiredoxin [Paraburkholderia bryophila]|uniref:Peroxiredoxin n=1 Tax=Paraburkholderia bryophila TaxID=420952 RepID=A0A329BEE4_9BURK|nr:peroxiredoxin [Paraburkholderia bryophila]RAS21236.1 peroxiredoxin [Paraburkholderia bryophila]
MNDAFSLDWSALPAPTYDCAANHLAGFRLPSVVLMSTSGEPVDLSALAGRTVVYAYPWKKHPDVALPEGWVAIPGAAGCTPQSCAFRNHASSIRAAGASHLFALSTQDTPYQREAVERLRLPFPILSDERLTLTRSLRLPKFEVAGMTLLKRLTMIINDGVVEHVFYPVFPPDRNAADVLAWLESHQ